MTFTALDLNITDEDRKAMYNEVMSVDDNYCDQCGEQLLSCFC